MIPTGGYRFSENIMLDNKPKRNADSTKIISL